MSEHKTTDGVYGPGTFTDVSFIAVPEDCSRVLKWIASITPGFAQDPTLLKEVDFYGDDLPHIPVLHAVVGITAREICKLKGFDTGKISIGVDHAALCPASATIVSINGKTGIQMAEDGSLWSMGTDLDHGALVKNPMHYRSWAFYPTSDPTVYYYIMGSLHPALYLRSFGLDPEAPVKSNDEAYELQKSVLSRYSARELEQKCIELGVCGQTGLSPKAWRETLMGKRLAGHPVLDYNRVPEIPDLPPVPFPKTPSDKRALAGIKVVEFSRVIVCPAVGAVLSSFGAEVIKINSPNLPDPNALQLTLTAGKSTQSADLNKQEDAERVHKLIEEADVVIQGFRKGAIERKGFGLNNVLAMANKRGKGIVYRDLNCYGPDGTSAERPALITKCSTRYQQIADAASGCSYICGKAYGSPEGTSVLPSLPVADMLTGVSGACEVMMALRDRAIHGGSYHCDVALTATDTIQCEPEMGLYPPEIVAKIQEKYHFGPMTPDLQVEDLMVNVVGAWATLGLLDNKSFYQSFDESPFGKDHTILAPMVHFDDKDADPQWSHSPRP
ncbi:hypothetical protein B0A55_04299 [Friedmanniomyces simplex]|uniref:Uncharacterized protein n=1 Tax=Friedmanniomyces simplex TaxID=329884 RepID=A0A4U0X5R9_9PEZI|nr:hypothetical protein B0A55_04299 [Friedmanniomyces simplex]